MHGRLFVAAKEQEAQERGPYLALVARCVWHLIAEFRHAALLARLKQVCFARQKWLEFVQRPPRSLLCGGFTAASDSPSAEEAGLVLAWNVVREHDLAACCRTQG